jgi:hypothetical protein
MQVKMIAQLTGTRDGEDWPRVGATIDLPDAEAADLIMNGYAVDPTDVEDDADVEDDDVETADAPDGDVETATPSRRRGKA